MILSGWILPDFYEVKCISCSTLNGHIEIVKRYLNNLKQIDLKLYDNIMYNWDKCSTNLDPNALDDMAVIILGWIKIIDTPMRLLFYNGKNKYNECVIRKYENLGYVCSNLDLKMLLISVPYNSQDILK